jgi:cytochrome b pre-mRNA-processing protein 3
MILSLFRKDPIKDAADALYAAAADQARLPAFYLSYGVEDSVEGRFEMAALHAYLLLRRLKSAGEDAPRVSRALSDVFFSEMDGALRELGVGDLSVGKKIRAMAEAFYGRIAAYESALAADGEPGRLASALSRNVYGEENAEAAARLADYVRRSIAVLGAQPDNRLLKGIVVFAAPAPECEAS